MSVDLKLPDTVQTVPAALAFWAERAPAAPAFIVPGRKTVTYAELWRSVRTLADALNAAGISRTDRVVLLLPDGPQLALVMLGTMTAAAALPLSVGLTATELESALHGLDAAAAIVPPGVSPATRACLTHAGVPVLEMCETTGSGAAITGATGRPAVLAEPPRPEDVAAISQTSGTTGKPKRVPRRHGGILHGGRGHRDRFGLSAVDRALAVAPMTLSLGRTAMLHGIAAGSALIFPPSFDLEEVWSAAETERPTWMHAAAGFLDALARHLRGSPASRPSSFRFVRVTAGPISPAICEELEQRLGAPILPSYSSSEAGAIATALPPPARRKPGSTGQPVQEIRIVDDNGDDAAPGAEGEIWVHHPKGFSGYLDDPELNAATLLPDDWFRTGDVGYLDEDGFLFLTGRVNELINRGGAKIAPAEVDEVLLAYPAVAAAAVFAVPDERLGEDIVAAVVLKAGWSATPRELRHWMLDRLAPHKAPRRIWFVAELPLTASGKVRRGALRDRYLATAGANQIL